ncbi:Uncharacterized protein GBIM_17776 [Gryllus bimaculatus]|nr:Uncharacterized protein GBIM_17776 [Gryllus bimaculatus]
MGASAVPVIIFTILWGVVGIVLPFVVPKGPNRGWLCCYMAQMNPLIGPKLSNGKQNPRLSEALKFGKTNLK